MMNRSSTFNSPFMIGFEHLERVVSHISKASGEGYPPHNIEQVGDNALRITLAVAGFDIEDLDITVAENQLTVRGRRQEDERDRVFLHRGIAARQFQRAWVLAEGWEVGGASLDKGLLHIEVRRPRPEPEVRAVAIRRAAPAGGRGKSVPANGSSEPHDASGTPQGAVQVAERDCGAQD
jgi:HSP20 family molecular chaperone IbpA